MEILFQIGPLALSPVSVRDRASKGNALRPASVRPSSKKPLFYLYKEV